MHNRIPVLIDCDPGVDDAHAILMALSSDKLDIRAITTVAGNMPVAITTDNALRIVELAKKDRVPVSAGCHEPIYRSSMEHSEMFHGKNGLGNVEIPKATAKPNPLHAVETIRLEIEKAEGRLHIIALGPLTNIAMLLKLYPVVKEKIAHLTVMGGAYTGGNMSKYAEFNFFCDPEAADIVMRSSLPITLVDLSGCENAGLLPEDANHITGIPSRISKFISGLWDFNIKLAERLGDKDFVIYDSIAVAAVIDPTVIETIACKVVVETKDEERYGQSIVTKTDAGNVNISVGTDRNKFLDMCKEEMRSYPLE